MNAQHAVAVRQRPAVPVDTRGQRPSLHSRHRRPGAHLAEWCLAAAVIALLVWASMLWTREPSVDPSTHRVVNVQTGDTLWSIARDNAVLPFSTAEMAHLILTINDLADSAVTPGSALVVPVTPPGTALLATR